MCLLPSPSEELPDVLEVFPVPAVGVPLALLM